MPLTNEQIMTFITSMKAQLDALAIAVAGQPESPSTLPTAQPGNILTLKSSKGKESVTTGTAKVAVGMMVRFANGRTTPVVATDDGITFTTREPAADNEAALKKLAGSNLTVEGGQVDQPKPTPVPDPTPMPTTPTAPITGIPLLGINLAAHSNANQVLPGEAGTHFKWPSRADVTLYVKTLGVRLIRFPYALQRATLLDSTGLPVKGGQLDPTFVAKMNAVLAWIREDSNGEALVIFDPHTYWRMYRNQTSGGKQTGALLPANEAAGQGGRWKRQEQVLIADENGWGSADLGDHIASMANTFDSTMILGYGAGNEPYADGMSVASMEAKVVADLNVMFPIIRKVTNKPVFVCGIQWASARNFAQVSGTFASGIKDPANNWIPEVHGYGDLSGDSSGRYSSGNLNAFPVDQIANVFRQAYSYMATKGLRCFVGETGIPPTDSARQALARALDEAKASGVPVTLWIAGGDGAMGGEKMNLDDAGHAATRDLIKARAGERIAEWKAVKA